MEPIRRWWQQPFYIKLTFIMLILMSIQFTSLEGYQVSFIKVGLMSIAIVYYAFNATINKAVLTGGIYWLLCLITSLLHGQMRWSTILYFGMFIGAYFTFYQCVRFGAFNLKTFNRFLKGFIFVFFITLVLQQFAVVCGFKNFPILNMGYSHEFGVDAYYKWNRLPTLTCEPSHSAIVLTGLVLGWIRTLEMQYGVRKIKLEHLLNRDNRRVTLAYLYLLCFMGSGTGWIGFGILLLYFVRIKTLYYIVPGIALIISIGFFSGSEQFQRAWDAASATLTMNQNVIRNADGSAAMRIVPLVNTVKTDLSASETWLGKGTIMENQTVDNWQKTYKMKISCVEQYGLIAFIASLIFLYSCAIKRVLSLETLCFVGLLTCNIGNVYIIWSMLYVFTVVRYLQEHPEEYDEENDECIDTDSKLQYV